ncbi:MAG: FeoB small GTPase domain-containing protein [Bacteroidales bacterium]|jgi:ferrous iron transport protein B|nr:FeoB small GTPase domain-containing protein [Bacteroidales bacterium]
MIKVALIGNPNVGKSVIFNNLTGLKQHVGNWPGVTVEKKLGSFEYSNKKIEVIDLPGTYSLTSRTLDEKIARDFIIDEKPDIVLDIVDAANIERNLYLTLLLMEAECNLVVVLNQIDIAEKNGIEIDSKKLSHYLGVPVIPTIATEKEGMDELKELILKAATFRNKVSPLKYNNDIEDAISIVSKAIQLDKSLGSYPLRWLSIKLLEGDALMLNSNKIFNMDVLI